MCSDIRLICHEFKTLNARGCVSNLHIDYLNPMLYIMYAWNGLSKCMQKLEIFLKTMIIPFCSMSLSTILLLQTCESLIGFLLYVWLFSAYMYFICMKLYKIYMYSGSVLEYFVVIVWIFVYMYMKYLLSPLCNKKCYISYNIVHNMKITTHILPMFLRAIKWKCSLLTSDFRHTVKVHEGKFPAGFI